MNQSINQTNYFIVRLKVDQRAGQLSLPHLGMTKTEKNRIKLKHKTFDRAGNLSQNPQKAVIATYICFLTNFTQLQRRNIHGELR